jgi:hypothetical protein
MLRIIAGLFLVSTIGCASPPSGPFAERQTVNASVAGIIRSFDRAAVGIRGRSANGRELVSKYHSPSGDGYDYADTKAERAYAKLKILGERRPYTLQVQYIIEKRNSKGVYKLSNYDQEKAEKVLKGVIDYLVTRPEREDFIDDFRPF